MLRGQEAACDQHSKLFAVRDSHRLCRYAHPSVAVLVSGKNLGLASVLAGGHVGAHWLQMLKYAVKVVQIAKKSFTPSPITNKHPPSLNHLISPRRPHPQLRSAINNCPHAAVHAPSCLIPVDRHFPTPQSLHLCPHLTPPLTHRAHLSHLRALSTPLPTRHCNSHFDQCCARPVLACRSPTRPQTLTLYPPTQHFHPRTRPKNSCLVNHQITPSSLPAPHASTPQRPSPISPHACLASTHFSMWNHSNSSPPLPSSLAHHHHVRGHHTRALPSPIPLQTTNMTISHTVLMPTLQCH